jgi:hypothetical protein
MLDSGVVGLVVGLVLIYFLLSLLCSGINEAIEAGLRHRAKFLEAGIVDLVGPVLKQRLYDHPIIDALHPRKGRLKQVDERPTDQEKNRPSYIPSKSFSQALASILTYPSVKLSADVDEATTALPVGSTMGFRQGFLVQIEDEKVMLSGVSDQTRTLEAIRGEDRTTPAPHSAGTLVTRIVEEVPDSTRLLEDVRASVDQLPAGPLRATLAGFLTTGGAQLDDWRTQLEGWFDHKMDRVSGWYSRRTRLWLILYAAVVVVALNADTALFARTLWRDATLRESVVAQAEAITADGATQEPCPDPDCVVDRLNEAKSLGLPLGWPDFHLSDWGSSDYADDDRIPHSGVEWILKFLGLALTAAALTMGAPFWFDILNKVGNFRSSGRPPPRPEEIELEAPTQ